MEPRAVVVSARFKLTNLESLNALARVDGNSVGDQIRRALDSYLETRKEDVQQGKKEWSARLRASGLFPPERWE